LGYIFHKSTFITECIIGVTQLTISMFHIIIIGYNTLTANTPFKNFLTFLYSILKRTQ
jgi:hypothetical protein